MLSANGTQAGGGAPIQNGTYTCIAGFRFMLTLGEMTVAGNDYSFHPPQGPDTAGTYSYVPGRITWGGDIGIVQNAQIVESDLGQGHRTEDFWFSFKSDMTNGYPVNVNCKL